MAEFTEKVHEKCQAFGDRIVKLNDYLLVQASKNEEERCKKEELRTKKKCPRIPIFLLSISNICNQLLRAGTSIGANNAEAINAISKNDYRSKSHIALKEARESLYWIELLHRNKYLDDKEYASIFSDAEELVKILVVRCKKLDAEV